MATSFADIRSEVALRVSRNSLFRYKTDLLAEQKENIKNLIKVQPHPFFSEEIRRELLNSKNRGEPDTQGFIILVLYSQNRR